MTQLLAQVLAGLGLYFVGVGGLRASLQQIPGIRFREKIAQAIGHPLRTAFTGFMLGTVTQTSIGLAVILAALVSRGLVTLKQALPLVAWSNVGLAVLVFLSFLPVHVAAMVLVGIGGICVNFGLGGRYRGFVVPFYSLGLILFGLWFLKMGLKSLAAYPSFQHGMDHLPESYLLAFALGAVLRVPIQSSSAVALIGITLNGAGIFNEDEAMMVFFGTGLGSGLAAHYLTLTFKGEMKQVALYEGVINGLTGIFLLVLFYSNQIVDPTLLHRWLDQLAPTVEGRLALVFLVQQLLCVVFAYGLSKPIMRYLVRVAPNTVEEDLSKPRFIHDQALYDIETALNLAEREILALLERFPRYLASLRSEATAGITASVTGWHQSSLSVIREIENFLAALSDKRVKNPAASMGMLRLVRQLGLVSGIEDALFRIAEGFPKLTADEALRNLTHNIVESLDVLLVTAREAAAGREEDIEALGILTATSGERAEKLRRDYLQGKQHLEHEDRAVLLEIISQFERVVWTLHQWSHTLKPASNPAPNPK